MGTTGEVHDRLINHLFGSGLTLAAVLSSPRLDSGVAERLRDVLGQLDAAIGEVRHLALSAAVAGAKAGSRLAAAPTRPQPEREIRLVSEDARRCLYQFAADETFAYAASGHDFYRVSDDVLWAHESDGFLLAAHSGAPFARRVGHVYYEVESDEPLYYERA
jgi:hypothetical protein